MVNGVEHPNEPRNEVIVYELDPATLTSVEKIADFLAAIGYQVKTHHEKYVNPKLLPYLRVKHVLRFDEQPPATPEALG